MVVFPDLTLFYFLLLFTFISLITGTIVAVIISITSIERGEGGEKRRTSVENEQPCLKGKPFLIKLTIFQECNVHLQLHIQRSCDQWESGEPMLEVKTVQVALAESSDR